MRPAVDRTCLLLLCLALISCASQGAIAEDAKPHAFEDSIAKFEERDRQMPPPEQAVLFVGSSSIRLWDVAKSFPERVVINRGFGGSRIADSVYYADRIVTKYNPRVIVFYAGDNDLAGGVSPEQVAADFQQFVGKVRANLPTTPIVFISIKPSIARWKLIERARKANALVAEAAGKDSSLVFVNVEPVMLGSDGQPRGELFVADGLHMNAKGYALWNGLVEAALKKLDEPKGR